MSPSPPAPPDAAILLVLLPLAPAPESPPDAAAALALSTLQRQLSPAVRVLTITETSHPAVVRSFGPVALPACVLVRQGVELWRQPGLPEAATVAQLLQVAQLP